MAAVSYTHLRRIFDMAASGASLAQIGQTLSDEKVLILSLIHISYLLKMGEAGSLSAVRLPLG